MTTKDLLLAIDNGTQSLKALVFDLEGQLLAKEQVKFTPYYSEQPAWAEQDPEVFWQALCEAMGKLKGRLLVGVINSIGVRRDAKAADPLVARLKDADAAVAAAAAEALGRIGGAGAAKALAQSLAGAPQARKKERGESAGGQSERLQEALRAFDGEEAPPRLQVLFVLQRIPNGQPPNAAAARITDQKPKQQPAAPTNQPE